uniref:Uncharacterized protein n=1 Tax=Tanacetum cinerariifolium TaxID=118510 RepID=A0A699S712_TANCI|nr:hypothetical protein [Tanacetum cinerariifolium]
MLRMLFFRLGVNEDIVDENNNELIELVKQIVDSRKRITVTNWNTVEFAIINTQAHAPILLLNKEDRCTPRRNTRSNKAILQHLL